MELLQNNWHIVEDNTKESFRLCKNDIINFGVQLAKVQQAQRDLAEEMGQLKGLRENQHDLDQRISSVQLSIQKNIKPDLSGAYHRMETLEKSIDKIRDNKFDHVSLEKEVKVLRQRYDELVGVTKNLVRVIEAQKQKVKIIHAKPKIIRKIVHTRPKIIKINAKRHWVASTVTMKVHDKHCPFAQNIKRKNKKVFKTRLTAFKKGYKACKCLK
ncbi:MAG: hypothetical protein AAB288_14000 [Acidobacteriota bacterium]